MEFVLTFEFFDENFFTLLISNILVERYMVDGR